MAMMQDVGRRARPGQRQAGPPQGQGGPPQGQGGPPGQGGKGQLTNPQQWEPFPWEPVAGQTEGGSFGAQGSFARIPGQKTGYDVASIPGQKTGYDVKRKSLKREAPNAYT